MDARRYPKLKIQVWEEAHDGMMNGSDYGTVSAFVKFVTEETTVRRNRIKDDDWLWWYKSAVILQWAANV